MPVSVLAKQHSGKLQVINDHSAGKFSCNSMIMWKDVSVKLDGIHSLGKILQSAWKDHGDGPIVLIKSDISQAYRLIPMHCRWQLWQIVSINGEKHVDQVNCFGGRSSCCLFWTFMSLILWICDRVIKIKDVLTYIDDNFSWELADRSLYYKPYGRFFPEKQTQILQLWDTLSILHEEKKQEFGTSLKIISYFVDTVSMTITMDEASKQDLLQGIQIFCRHGKPIRCSL